MGLPRRWLAPGWVLGVFLGVTVAFAVIRNLPWGAALAP